MFPMTIDNARAENAYRREVITRSYGAARRARRPRRFWRLPAVLRLNSQPRLSHR